MNGGLPLVVLTGALWAALGVLMSRRAERDGSPAAFYALGYAGAAIGGWLIVAGRGVPAPTPHALRLVPVIALAGVASAAYQCCLAVALRRGPHAATWAIAQSGLALPFLFGAVVYGDRIGAGGWIGVLLILAALPPSARPGGTGAPRPRWIAWTVATFACVGLQQILAGLPSRWDPAGDPARLRPALAFTATALVHLIWALRCRVRPVRADVVPALVFAACALASFCTLFAALDRLSIAGAAAVAFPIAVGTGIVLFAFWRRAGGEHPGRAGWTGMAMLVTGLLLVAWR